MAETAKAASDDKKGLHLAQEHEVKVDDYPTRSYRQAMTADQKAALEEAGLLR
jgi:hypothetical protein